MSYTKYNWNNLTWEKGQQHFQNQLNHMEDGIYDASQGGGSTFSGINGYLWDCYEGRPLGELPITETYNYKTGDYFVFCNVVHRFKHTITSYTGTTTPETGFQPYTFNLSFSFLAETVGAGYEDAGQFAEIFIGTSEEIESEGVEVEDEVVSKIMVNYGNTPIIEFYNKDGVMIGYDTDGTITGEVTMFNGFLPSGTSYTPGQISTTEFTGNSLRNGDIYCFYEGSWEYGYTATGYITTIPVGSTDELGIKTSDLVNNGSLVVAQLVGKVIRLELSYSGEGFKGKATVDGMVSEVNTIADGGTKYYKVGIDSSVYCSGVSSMSFTSDGDNITGISMNTFSIDGEYLWFTFEDGKLLEMDSNSEYYLADNETNIDGISSWSIQVIREYQ